MSGAYLADGRRKSSMVHATRGHQCDFCDKVSFGNGGKVAHGRGHVRRGEAVELVKFFDADTTGRLFLAVDDTERITKFEASGYTRVAS